MISSKNIMFGLVGLSTACNVRDLYSNGVEKSFTVEDTASVIEGSDSADTGLIVDSSDSIDTGVLEDTALVDSSDTAEIDDSNELTTRAKIMNDIFSVLGEPLIACGENGANIDDFCPDMTNDHEYCDAMYTAIEQNYLNALPNTNCDPDRTLMRAEGSLLIVNSFGLPVAEAETPFSDVGNEWYSQYVITAHCWGLFNGEGLTTEFFPGNGLTNEVSTLWLQNVQSPVDQCN